jgi:hypothetical protein
MRYDTPIYFVKNVGKYYDAEAGEWVQGTKSKVKKYVNIASMSAQRQQTVFGDVNSRRYILRFQRLYQNGAYDFIEIDGKSYQVETERVPSGRSSLVVVRNGD